MRVRPANDVVGIEGVEVALRVRALFGELVVREVLEQGSEGLADMRERCLAVTRTTYNWEAAVQPYLAMVASILR